VHKTHGLIESFGYCYRAFVSTQSDPNKRWTLYCTTAELGYNELSGTLKKREDLRYITCHF
jgi:hypothetical protein